MISNEVKKSVIDTNLTMVQLARELGMSRQNLHRILSGKAQRGIQTLRVARRLGIDEILLLPNNGEGEEHKSCRGKSDGGAENSCQAA